MEFVTADLITRLVASSAPIIPERVAIISSTEKDLRTYGWPLSDATLEDALTRILNLEPRAVGVDIYRDQRVGEGGGSLDHLLESNRRIFWISHFRARQNEEGVPPPAALPPNQVGFNDLLQDPDGVVRRGLLFMDDGKAMQYAFSLRLALAWLRPLKIALKPDAEDPSRLHLGAALIAPLQSDDGPYADMDAAGYQFLLHHRARRPLPDFTLGELLEGRIPEDALRDRVVLVGNRAASTGDVFTTPTLAEAAGSDSLTRGVDIHGRIIEQLIAEALGELPPTRPLGWGGSALLIWFWTLLGGLAGLLVDGKGRFAAAGAGGIGLLLFAAWAGLRFAGLWLPVVPPGIGLFAALSLLHVQRATWLKRQNDETARRNNRLEKANLRMRAELDLVRRMQILLLPRPEELSAVPGLEIAAHMEPAEFVGGDYYDLIPHPEGAWLAIGDATGHGLEAVALALMAQMGTRVLLADGQTDPKRFLGSMNLAMFQNMRRLRQDGSLTYCLVDIRADRLSVTGQHESLLLVRHDQVEEIPTQKLGFFIGFMPNITSFLDRRETPFGPGELLVLYSDGITEAADATGKEFGTEGLIKELEGRFNQAPEAVKEAILDATRRFVGENGRMDDDVTLVVVRRTAD